MSREYQQDGNTIRSSDGYVLNTERISQAHDNLFRLYGHPAAHELCKCLTAYMGLAVQCCNQAEQLGCKVSRAEMGKAAMDYLRALADGADQLFAQVKAKGN